MNVEETAASIKDMTIRGAGKIARAGAAAMSDFAANYSGNDVDSFLSDMEKAKKILLESRPTAVSLWNGVHATIKGVEDCKDVGEMTALIQDNAKIPIRNCLQQFFQI